MKRFFLKSSLNLLTLIALGVGVHTIVKWSDMPVSQRMVGVFFVGIVAHIWEENRFPGGFMAMIAKKLKLSGIDPHFGEMVTSALVLAVVGVPLFFPDVVWLSMAPMLIGILEAIAHLVAIKMFETKRPYSPGLATALFVLLPISLYTLSDTIQRGLMTPMSWLYSFLFMAGGLMLAQRIVVRSIGMNYSDFLQNVRGTLSNSAN